jgi:hypothetical protein
MAAGQEAPPPAALREGRGWLYRVRGRSPALGEEIVIYVLLPKLLTPSSLGRLATVLSGDPQFEREEAWAERLPFPATGYALVELEEGHVHSGIPDEVRVRRRLEEYRAR